MARLNSLPDTINKEQLLFGINQGAIYDDILNSVKQDNEVTFDFDSEEDNSAPVSYITYVIYK